MSRKFFILLGMTIGSIIGGFIPNLWGADFLSFSAIIFNAIGGLVGIFVAYKLTEGF